MNVKLQIIMKDSGGNEFKENIGYVNPNATDAQLYELAMKLCNLTTNEIVSVDKIVTTPLEGEDDG